MKHVLISFSIRLPLNIRGVLATLASAFLSACFFFCRAAWIGTGGRHHGVESPGRRRMTRSHTVFEQSNGLALVGVKETTDLFFLGVMILEIFADWRRVVYESFYFPPCCPGAACLVWP